MYIDLDCERIQTGVRCTACSSAYLVTRYERFGYEMQPAADIVATTERVMRHERERCSCGGVYRAIDQERRVWSTSIDICAGCGSDRSDRYAMGSYAGRYCDTPDCAGSWDAAPFRGKDQGREAFDYLDAGEGYDESDY